MQLVHKSESLSYSLFPPMPLLAAPPPRKQLCAPHIAGLLPARVAPQIEIVEIIISKPLSRDELRRQLGPIRSRDEMNAEIADIALEALQFLGGRRSSVSHHLIKEHE